jgi:hypothetical protein
MVGNVTLSEFKNQYRSGTTIDRSIPNLKKMIA